MNQPTSHEAIAIEPGAFDAQFGNGTIDNATKAAINALLGGWKYAIADGSTSNLVGCSARMQTPWLCVSWLSAASVCVATGRRCSPNCASPAYTYTAA